MLQMFVTKNKENANNKVQIYSIEPGRNWCIFPDTIEDIDENKEEGDEHGHPEYKEYRDDIIRIITAPPRHNLWLHKEANPANYYKHEAGQIHLRHKEQCQEKLNNMGHMGCLFRTS